MEARDTLEAAPGTGALRLERLPLNGISPALMSQWEAFLEQNPSEAPLHNPRWLLEEYGSANEALSVYFLYREDALAGFAPVVVSEWPVQCQLGEITLWRFPLRRLTLAGGRPHFPDEAAAYEMLFASLRAEESFDAIYLDEVAADSFLWKFAATSPALRNGCSPYTPEAPAPRVLLKMEGDFEGYMARFSSKHRQTLRRKVRKFQDAAPGETRCIRFTSPDEVEPFLERAVALSQKTYQWNLLGQGLRATGQIRKRLSFLARYGWLRCYLLMCKDQPCAFVTGYQYGSRYYLDDMGFDPEWRAYSVGSVLQLAIIEDLFSFNKPEVYDLGEYGPHKEEFSTDTCLQGKLMLFRPGAYSALVRSAHWSCRACTGMASAVLSRLGLKRRLKKLIRMWSGESVIPAPRKSDAPL
jgi:hypothetical protein